MNMINNIKKYWPEAALISGTVTGILLFLIIGEDLIKLTPLYLVSNLGVLVYRFGAHKKIWEMLLIAGVVGFIAEFVGVQSGLLFGDYIYGSILGPKLFDVPLMVIVMWGIIMLTLWSIVPDRYRWRKVLIVAISAVIYDFTLEHFATRFDLWRWSGSIPLSNAVGWFTISAVIAIMFFYRKYTLPKVPLVKLTLLCHTLFFAILVLL